MQIILKSARGTCSFLSERLFRWQMDRMVNTWADLVKRTKKFDEKKNKLYRSFQIYQWKIIQCNFSITASMIRYSSSFGVSNLEEVVRFGDYGCKVDWCGEWMRLTNDGITYGKLYLGERAMRFALGEETILKVYDRRENPYMRLGRLVPVEATK